MASSTKYGFLVQNTEYDGGTAWASTGNITVDDSSFASVSLSAGTNSKNLEILLFPFAIPSGSTIDGIEMNINAYASGSSCDWLDAYLIAGFGVLDSDDLSDSAGNPAVATSETVKTFGGPTELWGSTWTDADINAGGFGASIEVRNESGSTRTVYVDYITLTVYYTAPVGGSGVANSAMMLGCGI